MTTRRLMALLVGVSVLSAACIGRGSPSREERAEATPTTVAPPPPPPEGIEPYEGLGAWIDVFDYAPAYQEAGRSPAVTPAVVEDLAEKGVETLYLQVVRDDDRSPDGITDRRLAGELLIGAHAAGMRVVAWYLPLHLDVTRDVELARLMVDFEASGHRFDGLALDLEATRSEGDVGARNQRTIALCAALRAMAPDRPLGAITFSPVQLEVVNQALWPSFPYRAIAPYVDVWLPMAYWSFRSAPYDDPAVYVDESVRRLRSNVGQPDAAVHVIGGVADNIGDDEYAPFLAESARQGAVGVSVYDYVTTSAGGWSALAGPEVVRRDNVER